jgi:prepilin-type processing-associated H-X9-DG protein
MSWNASSDNTNKSKLTEAKLGIYTVKNTAVYHCPADQSRGLSQKEDRLRSVAMNAFVGDPGGANKAVFPGWQQFLKLSDFRNASGIFVLLDEHPDSINDGWFVYCTADGPPEVSTWSDLPASYHNGAGGVSFADGHSEIKRWTDSPTRKAVKRTDGAGLPVNTGGRTNDISWMLLRSTYKK